MAWSRETIDQIYSRMKADAESRMTDGVPITRFSLLGIILIVFSGAIHVLYGFLFWLSKQFFLDTMEQEYLDREARKYALSRNSATVSEGAVQFTGTEGSTIITGTTLVDSNGVRFQTTEEVVITGGSIISTTSAIVAGVDGNTTDTELTLENPQAGVDSLATITTVFTGGEDTETDEQLRTRLYQRIQEPPASGSCSDYERWALEVAGVGNAWCLAADEYMGAGTVAVIISDENLDPVGSTITQNVVDNIENKRPAKADPDVLDVTTEEVIFDISLDPNLQEYRDATDDALSLLFVTEGSPGGTVLLSHIRSAIASTGVQDYIINDIEVEGISIGVVDVTASGFAVSKYISSTYTDL